MLSTSELRSSLFLDFEGEGKKKNGEIPMPRIAGIFRPNERGRSGVYSCFFFDKQWAPASSGISAAEQLNFHECFDKIASELEQKATYLIYWTIHEEVILKNYLPKSLHARLEPYLYNLHPAAKKHLNRRNAFSLNGTAKGKTLEEYFAIMYPKRSPFAPLTIGAAEACRRIDTTCQKYGRWRQFSDKQKQYVKDLVAYNEGDCRSTWLIAKKLGSFVTRSD